MLPALIGAATSLAGGLLSANSQKEANKASEAHAARQEALQKEFAQSGIQWKVADAEKAGVHPLFALGANTTSYQPTNVGGGATDFSWLGETGQNIGRAIDATRSTPASAMALQLGKIQLEGAQLDNELKRTQLASAIALNNQTGPHPGLPSFGDIPFMEGQGDSPIIATVPPGHKAVPPQYTAPDLALWNRRWERRPGSSDAQTWEDVYGDESALPAIVNNVNGYLDAMHNSHKSWSKHVGSKLRTRVNPYSNQRPWAPRGRGY